MYDTGEKDVPGSKGAFSAMSAFDFRLPWLCHAEQRFHFRITPLHTHKE